VKGNRRNLEGKDVAKKEKFTTPEQFLTKMRAIRDGTDWDVDGAEYTGAKEAARVAVAVHCNGCGRDFLSIDGCPDCHTSAHLVVIGGLR
jgi:hypothetical protein